MWARIGPEEYIGRVAFGWQNDEEHGRRALFGDGRDCAAVTCNGDRASLPGR